MKISDVREKSTEELTGLEKELSRKLWRTRFENDVPPPSAPAPEVDEGELAVHDMLDMMHRDRKEVKMDFVYAVLFNCESGAGAGGPSGSPSVWRLRSLKLSNVTAQSIAGRNKTPPPEMEDRWYIQEMKFARREPRAR